MTLLTEVDLRRIVLVPVARVDRRALAAVEHARRIPADDLLAVHVVDDERAATAVADAWRAAELDVPLEMLYVDRSVAGSVATLVEDVRNCGAQEVVLVLGRQALRRGWHRLLHDGTADAIAARVAGQPGVIPVVVSVPA